MGFRYKKSINLGGGVKLNAGKKGIGISAGTKGLRISHSADGKTRVTASIPGTGVSYQETISSIKQKTKSESNNFDNSSVGLLYEFTGIVRNKTIDGERDTLSVLLHQPSTVSFYNNATHIKTFDTELGGDEIYCSVAYIKIEKNIREGRFLFKKYRDVEVILIVDNGSMTEYTILVKNDSVADALINWSSSVMELTESPFDILNDGSGNEEEDEFVLTCTNCFTKGIVENWQVRKDIENNCWRVYCRHCSEEYLVGITDEYEETL